MSRSMERNSSPSSGAYQMWLGNIPFDATEEDLKTLLSRVGRVLQVRIKYDEGGQSKGFAFCEFPDPETCYLAYVTLNNVDLGGRKLKIDFATDELRQRFGSSGGGGPSGGVSRPERRKAHAAALPSSAPTSADETFRGAGAVSSLLGPFHAGESLLGPAPSGKLAGRGRDSRGPFFDTRAPGFGLRSRALTLYDGAAAATDIMEILRTFSTTQLLAFLGDLKKLMKEDAASCRRLLRAHPALVYAALHAVYLLGASRAESDGRKQEGRSSQRSSSLAPPEKKQKVADAPKETTREAEKRATSLERDDLRSLERRMGLPEAQLEKARRNRAERLEQLQHAGLSVQISNVVSQDKPVHGRAHGAGEKATRSPGDVGTRPDGPGGIGGLGPQAGGAQLASPLAPEKVGPIGDRAAPLLETPAVGGRPLPGFGEATAPPQAPLQQAALVPQSLAAVPHAGGQSVSLATPLPQPVRPTRGLEAFPMQEGTEKGPLPGLPVAQRGAARSVSSPPADVRGAPVGAPHQGLPLQAVAGSAVPLTPPEARQGALPVGVAAEERRPVEESLRVAPGGRQSEDRDISFTALRGLPPDAAQERGLPPGGPPHALQAPHTRPQAGRQAETLGALQPGRGGERRQSLHAVPGPSTEAQMLSQAPTPVAGGSPHPALAVPPASDALVDEVLKSPDILSNVLGSTPSAMRDWPEEQRQQVLALQSALLRRGFRVAQ
ncbi:putative mRNA processing protein [Neospora caninum Liverpool]|uniref:Putative mRNA processing protein n=1 Tax=Neospora caninum (strain Liverpool) TaxID=572307 RepID=F0VCP6_NEOCL|nr:putative mRNA processing protein [Neospora caninum Liverpool]CBZ51735.1 putative mRNA processing protein [Neospora caninum Liverpool]CEL65691.1 TPA: mRNA processing protein, putative [Neospora caninum Liverpool]|eukprot:XP_003881768.1 putative mRNA processing protein [Neospora caninum Liverpool]